MVLPGPFAKEFIAKVPDEMRNRRFICKLMLFSRQLAGLDWARNEQYLAFGGVSNREEDVLKFCSGDPMMGIALECYYLITSNLEEHLSAQFP